MSDYICFCCLRTTHTSELNRIKTKNGIELICNDCLENDCDEPNVPEEI